MVTTGTFSVKAQQEQMVDQYPLVLIDGSRMAQELREEMVRPGIALNDLLLREAAWYVACRFLHPLEASMTEKQSFATL